MRVKACGAMTEMDFRAAELAGADAIGVISPARSWPDYQKSEGSHTVAAEQALWLKETAHDELEFVWLPRRTSDFDEITDFASILRPDRIQIGETEDPELSAALHEHYGDKEDVPKIARVIHVGNGVASADILPGTADYIHLDSAGERPGGNGVTHDLEASAEIAEQAHAAGMQVVLAGGLTVANVAEAIAVVRPDEVDVESSIRAASGLFNQIGIQKFAQAAREAGGRL